MQDYAFNLSKPFSIVLLLLMLTACKSQPIYEALGRPIHTPAQVSEQRIGQLIKEAGEIVGWKFKYGAKNELIGRINFPRGAMAEVSVTFSKSMYEIRYKDSAELRYNGNSIHATYNKTVRRLDEAIRIKLNTW
ncbi:MAG: hypothetical protein OEZ68_05995 [Gammaproteobacteria bacterium]|nr:hypothetical protein [Gammaproteobacteria bacterium]MDH5800340.1 hypothetical protein [Gammaproteobacteria bacterium]